MGTRKVAIDGILPAVRFLSDNRPWRSKAAALITGCNPLRRFVRAENID